MGRSGRPPGGRRALTATLNRLSASYHVLVVGHDLGGLIYAALAARAGYRVCVLGQGARPNVYRHHGHAFLRTPERFCGFATSPVVEQVFTDLSMGMAMRNRPRPVRPTVQLVTPDRRLDVAREPERWHRELARELPDEGEALRAFDGWARRWTDASHGLLGTDVDLPPTGFRAKAQYRKAVEGLEHLLEVLPPDGVSPLEQARDAGLSRTLVEAALTHLSTLRTRPLPPLARARLWTHLRSGIYRVPGGLDGLKDLFIGKLKDQCGDHRPDAEVERIVLRRGRAAEVQLADRSERLGCQLLVANTDPRRFLSLVPPDKRHERFHGDMAAREPVAWRLTVNLAVDPRVVPAGMGPEVVYLADPRGALDGPDCLWISRPGVAPFSVMEGRPGEGVLTVTTLLPARGIAPSPAAVERTVEEVLARLRALIPWLDEHLLAVDVPALWRDPHGALEVDVTALEPVMGEPLEMTADLSAAAVETPYRNVLMSGSALFGALGFEGAFLGAVQTLRATRRLVKLKVLRPDLG